MIQLVQIVPGSTNCEIWVIQQHVRFPRHSLHLKQHPNPSQDLTGRRECVECVCQGQGPGSGLGARVRGTSVSYFPVASATKGLFWTRPGPVCVGKPVLSACVPTFWDLQPVLPVHRFLPACLNLTETIRSINRKQTGARTPQTGNQFLTWRSILGGWKYWATKDRRGWSTSVVRVRVPSIDGAPLYTWLPYAPVVGEALLAALTGATPRNCE